MRNLVCAAVAVTVTATAAAQTIPVTVVSVYDGDTVTVEAQPWPGVTIRSSVRVNGIDTPEMRGGCDASKAKAREARDALVDMLTAADLVEIRDPFHGRYAGRVVADVLVDGRNVAGPLVAAGLALPYEGGRRQDWCVVLGAQP